MLLSVRGVGDAFCVEPPLKLNSYSSTGGSDPARLPPWVSALCLVLHPTNSVFVLSGFFPSV